MDRETLRLELLRLPRMSNVPPANMIEVARNLEAYITEEIPAKGAKVKTSPKAKDEKESDNFDNL